MHTAVLGHSERNCAVAAIAEGTSERSHVANPSFAKKARAVVVKR